MRFLSLIYIIFDNLLIKNKNFSGIGYILLSAGTVLICGYIVAYKVIKNIVNKTLIYATKAKRADEIKSDFAMSLAHDLKSPLVTIKANISNLETGLIGILTKEQNEALFGTLVMLTEFFPKARIVGADKIYVYNHVNPGFDVKEWLGEFIPEFLQNAA